MIGDRDILYIDIYKCKIKSIYSIFKTFLCKYTDVSEVLNFLGYKVLGYEVVRWNCPSNNISFGTFPMVVAEFLFYF